MLEVHAGTRSPNRLELTSATDVLAVVALIGEHDPGQYESLAAAPGKAVIRASNVVLTTHPSLEAAIASFEPGMRSATP